jgi:hypothetical protein
MPHSPTTNSFNYDNLLSPSQRFLCPVETCQRACRSKTAWTKHLRSVHAHVDFSKFQSQNTIIDLPHVSSQTLENSRALGSLPTSPVTPNLNRDDAHAEYDFEMGDVAHDAAGSDFFHSDSRSSPPPASEVGDNKDYHPIINGEFLFNFDHTPTN